MRSIRWFINAERLNKKMKSFPSLLYIRQCVGHIHPRIRFHFRIESECVFFSFLFSLEKMNNIAPNKRTLIFIPYYGIAVVSVKHYLTDKQNAPNGRQEAVRKPGKEQYCAILNWKSLKMRSLKIDVIHCAITIGTREKEGCTVHPAHTRWTQNNVANENFEKCISITSWVESKNHSHNWENLKWCVAYCTRKCATHYVILHDAQTCVWRRRQQRWWRSWCKVVVNDAGRSHYIQCSNIHT